MVKWLQILLLLLYHVHICIISSFLSLFQSFLAVFVLYKAINCYFPPRPTLLKPSIRTSTNYCYFTHSGERCWWHLHYFTPNLLKYEMQNNKYKTFSMSWEVTDIFFKMSISRFYLTSFIFFSFRFHVCAQSLPFGQTVAKNPAYFLLMIWDMSEYTKHLIRLSNNGNHSPFQENEGLKQYQVLKGS